MYTRILYTQAGRQKVCSFNPAVVPSCSSVREIEARTAFMAWKYSDCFEFVGEKGEQITVKCKLRVGDSKCLLKI